MGSLLIVAIPLYWIRRGDWNYAFFLTLGGGVLTVRAWLALRSALDNWDRMSQAARRVTTWCVVVAITIFVAGVLVFVRS